MSFPIVPLPKMTLRDDQREVQPLNLVGLMQMHQQMLQRQEDDKRRMEQEAEQRAEREEQQFLQAINAGVKWESAVSALPNVRGNRLGLFKDIYDKKRREEKEAQARPFESAAIGQLGNLAQVNPNDPRLSGQGLSEYLGSVTPTLTPEFEKEMELSALRQIQLSKTQAELDAQAVQAANDAELAQKRRIKQMEAGVDLDKSLSQTLMDRELAKSDPETLAIMNAGAPDINTAIAVKNGKMFQEGMLGGHILGSQSSPEAQASRARAQALDILVKMEIAANNFAKTGKGSAFTGTVEAYKKQFGENADPFFAELDTLRANAKLIISLARSGKTLTEREISLMDTMFAADNELRIVNGRLTQSAQSRMNALISAMESETINLYPGPQRQKRRSEFQSYVKALRLEIRAGDYGTPHSTIGLPGGISETPGSSAYEALVGRMNRNAP